MIDVKITTLGGPEIARQLERGPGAIRFAIREELAEVLEEIRSRAAALAPKRSGIMAERIVWYFGSEATRKQQRAAGLKRFGSLESDTGPVVGTVRPTGSVAHLMERGVNATRKAHFRRELRVGVGWTRKGKKTIRNERGRTFVQAHPFKVAAHPFFIPAVESVGGAAGVNARLQAALTRRAPELMRGAA